MIKIYHNPRCKKSREGLEILEKSGKKFEIVKYLENIPTKQEFKEIISYLDMEPIDLVRKTETIWKEKFKSKSLSSEEIIDAMLTYPKLIERPIVVKDKKAVIGRPASNIDSLINE